MRSIHRMSVCFVLLFAAAALGGQAGQPTAAETINLGLRGVYFVPNKGQWSDAEVVYGLRSRGVDVAFRESALTMHITREAGEGSETTEASLMRERGGVGDNSREAHLADASGSLCKPADLDRLTLAVTFPGSNNVLPVGAQPQTAKFNYFVGGEGRSTASDVPSFGEVVYENLYDGVDLHVMGNDDGVLKYEFHVAPGGDYNQIRIHYDGIDSLCIDDAGDLKIETLFGTLSDAAPVVWQEDAETRLISAHFELCDAHTYRIALGDQVDPTGKLVIDPSLDWMIYLGGDGEDWGYGVATDSAGNALATGSTVSAGFEGRNNGRRGSRDGFVLKIAPNGQLRWMTYVGGTDEDWGYGITADSAGNALVAGWTRSTDFQGHTNLFNGERDGFAVSVSAAGRLQWMRYLGGAGWDTGYSIAVDAADGVWLAGYTSSTDFEGRRNSYHGGGDAVVLKLSQAGELDWMTYLGGGRTDVGNGIAVDGAGNVIVAGRTNSDDFEGRIDSFKGGSDAFAVKVDPSGEVQWMTYLGGSLLEDGTGVAIDSEGNALVSGTTDSVDYAGANNSYHGGQDASVTKINPTGQLEWMRYVGGFSQEYCYGVAVDSDDSAQVSGWTNSTNFEGRTNESHGGAETYVASVRTSGVLKGMSYLGGTGHDYGYGITVDSADNTFVTGWTESTDFEGRLNAHHGWRLDAFVVRLCDVSTPQLIVDATCPSGGPIEISWFDATPDGTVALIASRSRGSLAIPNGQPCAGTVLGLGSDHIRIVFQGSGGANGSRTINSNAAPGACNAYLQLLDIATCATSNVVKIQ